MDIGSQLPACTGRPDVSRPPSRNGVWKVLLEWLGAAALVPLLVLALVAAGTALLLVVRLIINIVSWVIGSIS